MRNAISFTAIALALVTGCSGQGEDGLVGRWLDPSGNEIEFSSDGRYASYREEPLGEGTYTAEDGILTIEIETSFIESPEPPSHQQVSYWTGGDTLQTLFASPDHGGDDIAGTWRRETVTGSAGPDGSVELEVTEVVTELAADGTVVEEVFLDGIAQEPDTGTYTVSDGAIRFTWKRGDSDVVEMRDLRDRRMGGVTYVRIE